MKNIFFLFTTLLVVINCTYRKDSLDFFSPFYYENMV